MVLRLTPKRMSREMAILNCDARIGEKSVSRGALTISKASLDRFAGVPW
jgi:hypothetical protein